MFGYIYLTTNLKSGALYIGQSHGEFNKFYLGSGAIIIKSIKSYGRENFKVEMIEEAFDQGDLNNKEIKHIREHREKGLRLYNLLPGGKGFPKGWKLSEATKKKLSDIQKGRPIPHKEKMVAALRAKIKGVPKSPEHRAAIGRANLGKKRTQAQKDAIGRAGRAAMLSPERRAKRSKMALDIWVRRKARALAEKELYGNSVSPIIVAT